MNYRRVLVVSVVVLAVAGFVALLWGGLARKEPPTGASGSARVNRPAEDFTLPLFSGGDITLSDLKGKPVVLNFWASWCPPCREEAPILEQVWRRYKDKGVTFIGVDIQDAEADARAYIKEFGITYPNGPDIGGKITIDYGVGGIPVTFFVNRDGRIVSRWVGAINERILVSRIEGPAEMTGLVPTVGFGFAFLAGLISFLSPCVVPLVPGYLSYVSGVSIDNLEKPSVSQLGRILLSSGLFVLGFTLVFVSLGTSFSLLGSLAEAYRRQLTLVSGGVMVFMGIMIMDIMPVKLLERELRFRPETRGLGMLGGIPLGMAFGLGWLPCVGPVLASILFFASTAETALQGTMLLLVYSLGLGLAFILTGALFSRALRALRWVQRHRRVFNILGGGVLVVMGLLFISNRFFFLSLAAQKLYYKLFY